MGGGGGVFRAGSLPADGIAILRSWPMMLWQPIFFFAAFCPLFETSRGVPRTLVQARTLNQASKNANGACWQESLLLFQIKRPNGALRTVGSIQIDRRTSTLPHINNHVSESSKCPIRGLCVSSVYFQGHRGAALYRANQRAPKWRPTAKKSVATSCG